MDISLNSTAGEVIATEIFSGIHSGEELINGKKKAVTVRFDPSHLVKTLRSVLTTEYLEKVADIIAQKAAKRFVEELIKNIDQKVVTNSQRPRMIEEQEEDYEDMNRHRKDMDDIDEHKATKLLRKPADDGDNLEELPNESLIQSIEKSEDNQTKIPVIGLMKINGVYYRRFLGVI